MQDYTRYPLPRTEQSNIYDSTLSVVKENIDKAMNNRHHLHAWLNEVQAHLNRARETACQNAYDEHRERYEDEYSV